MGVNMEKQERGGAVGIGIGERIKAVRGGRTIPEFADSLLIHKSTLIRYEKEESYPDAKLILKFCEKENINPNWLLTGNGPKSRWAVDLDSLHNMLRKTFKKKFSVSSKEEASSFCEKTKIGLSPEVLLSYLSGEVMISGEALKKICELSGMDSDFIENSASYTIGPWQGNTTLQFDRPITLDRSILLRVLSRVENFIEIEGLHIDQNKKAHLVVWLYENIMDGVFEVEDIKSQLKRIAGLIE
ncbi:MAG: XRE family transcriptional regulator [Clostridia bacterium]|nr:XRE family transcriptional regulator [Clostridia bacterium]